MKTPSDRRRFFSAREGKFQIKHPGGLQADADPARIDPPPAPAAAEKEAAAAPSTTLKLPGLTVREPATPVELPAVFRPGRPANPEPEPRPGLAYSRAWWLALVCLALGGLGGYLFPRAASQPRDPATLVLPPEAAGPLTPGDHNELDAAYAARHANKFAEAEQLFGAFGGKHREWRGAMAVELGLTQLYEKKLNTARATLKEAIDKGWMPAEANFNQGVVCVVAKAYREAEASFARAVALDPTRHEFYYFWGECLRNEGKPLEASAKFRSALLRNQYETNVGLYRLKFWLSRIESDQAKTDGTDAEIDAALTQPRPPMEALFAAAARDLGAGRIQAAAEHLARARQFTEANLFTLIINDPLFVQDRARPELTEFFQPGTPDPSPKTDGTAGAPTPAAAEDTAAAAKGR